MLRLVIRYSKGVCKFSTGNSTCVYFIFLITGLLRLMRRHTFQIILRLHGGFEHWLYVDYAFQIAGKFEATRRM